MSMNSELEISLTSAKQTMKVVFGRSFAEEEKADSTRIKREVNHAVQKIEPNVGQYTLFLDGRKLDTIPSSDLNHSKEFYEFYTQFKKTYLILPTKKIASEQLKDTLKDCNMIDQYTIVDNFIGFE